MNKFEQLKKLDEVGRQEKWQDYLQLGFNEDDVAGLIDIINKDIKDWPALHAWRALGQIKSLKAVDPLLSLFGELCDDDWALPEMSKVMGMIGEPALEPLLKYTKDKRRKEFARVMAVDAMIEIAKHYPETRQVVLNACQEYMQKADEQAGALNGLLISYLVDIKATELHDDIKTLFAKKCIDFTICGDLEEVEILLGLRTKRDTPKPDYRDPAWVKHLEKTEKIYKENRRKGMSEEYCKIDEYLMEYGRSESILGISELDGFLSAIACAPKMMMPSQWMAEVWGGEKFSPEWESIEEVQEFSNLILGFYSGVMQSFQENLFEPSFLERQDGAKTEIIVDEWCDGFWRGYLLWQDEENRDDPAIKDALVFIYPFTSGTQQGKDMHDAVPDEQLELYQAQISSAVNKVFRQNNAKYLDNLGAETFKRDQPKVGRNDFCPCGSGKKFKKCCLH